MILENTDLFIGVALDRSGSMQDIWDATLENLNSFKNEQAEIGNTWLTLLTFDSIVETPYYAWGAKDVPNLTRGIVSPRGSTALRDGVADLIHSQEQWLSENLWFTGKVMTVVQTDGLENASTRTTPQQLRDLISRKEKAGWVFVYFGANQDAWTVGQQLGTTFVGHTRTYNPTAAGVYDSYTVLGTQTTGYRTGTISSSGFNVSNSGSSGGSVGHSGTSGSSGSSGS